MAISALREARAKIVADLKVLGAGPLNPETREKIDAMLVESRTLGEDIKRLETSEELDTELRSTQRPPRPNPSAEVSSDEEQERRTKAFSEYIRFGEQRMSAESRAALERRDILASGSAGALVPQQFDGTLIEATKLIGNTLSVVNTKVTNNNGAPMKFSLSSDVANIVTLTGEASAVTEADPSFTTFVLGTDMVATLVKTSVQELADSAFQVQPWLTKQFGTRYARGLETIITNGNGSNVSALTAAAVLGATTAASGDFPVYADLINCYGALDGSYLMNAQWMMSHKSRVYLMGLLDGFGRPFFLPNPNTGILDHILGMPICINQALPNTNVAGNTGILLGDFSQGYTFRTDGDLTIERLDELFKGTLEVGFLAYGRIGGAATNAGTNPIVSLATHA